MFFRAFHEIVGMNVLSIQSSELAHTHPQESVAPTSLGPRGETHSLAGEGGTQLRRWDRHSGTPGTLLFSLYGEAVSAVF
jgi:hypothetical protein